MAAVTIHSDFIYIYIFIMFVFNIYIILKTGDKTLLIFYFYSLFFSPYLAACEILVPQLGIEPTLLAVES